MTTQRETDAQRRQREDDELQALFDRIALTATPQPVRREPVLPPVGSLAELYAALERQAPPTPTVLPPVGPLAPRRELPPLGGRAELERGLRGGPETLGPRLPAPGDVGSGILPSEPLTPLEGAMFPLNVAFNTAKLLSGIVRASPAPDLLPLLAGGVGKQIASEEPITFRNEVRDRALESLKGDFQRGRWTGESPFKAFIRAHEAVDMPATTVNPFRLIPGYSERLPQGHAGQPEMPVSSLLPYATLIPGVGTALRQIPALRDARIGDIDIGAKGALELGLDPINLSFVGKPVAGLAGSLSKIAPSLPSTIATTGRRTAEEIAEIIRRQNLLGRTEITTGGKTAAVGEVPTRVTPAARVGVPTGGDVRLYRGQAQGGEGRYYSTDKDFAREFTQSGLESEISEIVVPANRVYRGTELPFAKDVDAIDRTLIDARAKGYDAIWVDEGLGQPPSALFVDPPTAAPGPGAPSVAREVGAERAWDVDDWNRFIRAEEERLVRMPDAPEPYQGPARSILNKITRGTGRGEHAVLNEQEQALLRQFIDEEGIDSEFLGLTSRIWTGENQVIVGIMPRKLFGAGWKGHEYITWAPAKNTFVIHSTRPDPREVMRAGGTFQFGPRAITGAEAAPSPTRGMAGDVAPVARAADAGPGAAAIRAADVPVTPVARAADAGPEAAAIRAVEEVAEGGLPPTQPPVRPVAEGAGAGVPPGGRITTGFPELDNSLAQARSTVAQDAPGRISSLIDRIPLIGRIRRWERPALDLPENIHVAHVGQGIAEGKFSTQAFSAENRFLRSVDDAFGPGASTGAKVDVPFIGNPSEISRPIHQTVLDIAQRPHLYSLTDAQTAIFTAGRQMDDDLLRLVNEGYGIGRNQFPAPEGGMHWPNVDVSENALVVFEGNVVSAARTGRGRTRIFDTAAERVASDKQFVPETNLRILLRANNDSKARAIGHQTFKLGSGGKTRIEVIDEVQPGLRQARNDLTQQLTNLSARIQTSIRQIGREGARTRRLGRRLKTTENRAASILERSENLADDFGPALATVARRIRVLLREAQSLDDAILVSTQRGAAAGAKQKTLLTELSELAPRLDRLRARYEAANLRGNVLVQEGLFRYFPAKEARQVEKLLEVSNNKFLQFTENWRNTAFNADLSPLAGIQAPNAFFIDPDGTTLQLTRGLAQVRSPSDLLRGFRASALADDIAKDLASFQRYSAGTGRPITAGTTQEFAGGLLNRIPGFTTANQSMFTLLTRMQKRQFDDMVLSLTKEGIPENEAIAVAGDLVNKVFPMVNRRLLGQSSARATLLRSTLTSVSFIRQPAALMADAARGMVKVGLRQDVTPKERIAMRLMLKMAITIEGIAILSNQLSAKMRGQDSARALKDSLDPTSGKFMSLVFPSGSSIGLGGPFRSLIKAIVPREVKGLPVPLPFMGLGNWAISRAGPFFRTQYDLIRNEDFEGNKIITGDFPVNILQAILFEIEGGIPLTAGSGLEGIRTGKPIGDITREIFSQFMGQNFREETPFQERHAEVVRWAESMGILGPEGREVESYFDLTKAERIEFGNQFPELGEDVVRETERRAAGGQPWARYRVRIEQIETEKIKDLTALGLLEVGKRDPQTGTRLERGDLDDAYRSIQSEAYTRKNEAAHNFEIEFEDKEEPTPEEAALQEYYDLGDKSEVNGIFIGRLWANNHAAFEKKLQSKLGSTSGLLEFVRANTNLGPFPEGLLDKEKGLLGWRTLERIDNSITARAKIKSRRKNK